MKKWKVLIPSLTAILSVPVFSLCGCVNNAEDNIKLVQFDSQFGSYVPSVQVEVGQKITKPANPTREGHTFVAWYVQGTTKAYNFAQPVEDNMVLYAKWNEVPSPAPTDIILNSTDLTLNIGDSWNHLSVQVLPQKASQQVTWTSSSESIVHVDSTTGELTANAGGKAIISVHPNGYPGIFAQCTVTVIESDEPANIHISKTDLSLEIGDEDHLYAQVLPQKAAQEVEWDVEPKNIVKISPVPNKSEVEVEALAKGEATITVWASGHTTIATSCKVNVIEHEIPQPEWIRINKAALTLSVNTSEQLHSYISPVEASQDTTWISDDESVATVNETTGEVTAKAVGTTTISAWPKGYEESTIAPAVCSVTVIDSPEPPVYNTVTFNTNGGTIIQPETVKTGECAVKPQNPTKFGYGFINWYSDEQLTSPYNFATPVTGDTTIYAKWEQKAGVVYVNVLNPVEDGFTIAEATATIGEEAELNITSESDMNESSVYVVMSDGLPISDYTFALSDQKHATLTIPGTSIIGDIQVGFNVNTPEPVAHNFETDPWTTVCYYADQGLDALCKAYDKEESSWFIGKTRKIVLNSQIHYVKVVGVNQDTYGADDKLAALTFQFDTVVSNSSGNGLGIEWDKINSGEQAEYNTHHYWGSTVDKALNSPNDDINWKEESSIHKSVYSMMLDSNATWAGDYIKDVNRSVNVYDESSTEDVPFTQEPWQTKLFCPTLSNIFSNKGISDTDWELISNNEKDLYKAEGQTNQTTTKQYAYYADSSRIGDKTVNNNDDPEETFECLKITDAGQYGQETAPGRCFWTASPFLQPKRPNEEPYSWEILSQWTGETGSMQSLFNGWISSALPYVRVAPCFCI